MTHMEKKIFTVLTILALTVNSAIGAATKPDRFINKALYNNVYPSTINNTETNGIKTVQAAKNVNKPTVSPNDNRRIVKKRNIARVATSQKNVVSPAPAKRRVTARQNTARAGVRTTTMPRVQNNDVRARSTQRRPVVARSGIGVQRNRSGIVVRDATANTKSGVSMSSQQCFAGYKECMDSYCERKDTAYNRCFCSAKLAQIDSKYQNKIDSLIQQIIKLKYDADATDEEIKSYWDETVGQYTQTNPWTNIDNALNIDWANMADRIRGQNAFNAGHTYCVQHLRACSYMGINMRDAYKSEIERDCATYEKGLEKIQIAAESVIESYDE